MFHRVLSVVVLWCAVAGVPSPGSASVPDPDPDRASVRRSTDPRPAPGEPRVRTTDRRVRALIDEAVLASPSLRALVERVEQSDVVVYVQCEPGPPSVIAGRLTFVTSAGGLRYVLVRLRHLRSRVQQMALLAHELQHAVELVDKPAILDAPSLAREYARFGHINVASSPAGGLAFDTSAAVEMGRRVLSELNGMAGD